MLLLMCAIFVAGDAHGGSAIDPDSLPAPGAQSNETTEFQGALQSAMDNSSAEHHFPLPPSTTLVAETAVSFVKGNIAMVTYLNNPSAENLKSMSVAFVESGLALTGGSLAFAVAEAVGIAASAPVAVAIGIAIAVASNLAAVSMVSAGTHK